MPEEPRDVAPPPQNVVDDLNKCAELLATAQASADKAQQSAAAVTAAQQQAAGDKQQADQDAAALAAAFAQLLADEAAWLGQAPVPIPPVARRR